MDGPRCVMRMYRTATTLLLRVEGRATMHQSLTLRQLIEQGIRSGITRLLLDLRHCTYLDSTFLGTLLVLQRTLVQQGRAGGVSPLIPGELALVAPSPECRQLLEQMGLLSQFPVVDIEGPAEDAWTVLPEQPLDVPLLQRNVVQAHQELDKIPTLHRREFQAVLRCLASEGEVGKQ